MDEFNKLGDAVGELVESFLPAPVIGDTNIGITQYSFWLFVATLLFIVIMLIFVRKQAKSLVPHGVFVNGIEYLIDFVKGDLCKGTVGDKWREHFPFIATTFFFILINNIIGLIPGMHPGTGTIGVTLALALVSFCYFIAMGVKTHGGWGYLMTLKPKGVPFPMNWLVWVIELLSTFLRLITLAVRLFCNLFAGHIIMGSFSILISLFMSRFAAGVSLQAFAGAGISVLWLVVLLAIYAVELLAAVIQAYVFSLLSAVYVQIAEEEH